ncbi:MAG: J domain-containing protein [Candidatus Margulisbacteria bacterium]|nr:J domain-containing protein [Candidatus Margulisiibacteriota bacterium]
MNKENKMRWVSGLLIILAFSGGPVLPTLIAYATATSVSAGIRRGTEHILKTHFDFDPKTASRISYFTQFFTYAYSFRYGYKAGLALFPEQVGMTVSDAFEALDLPSDATKSDIKKAFREQGLIYHPDKLRGMPENEQNMMTEKFRQAEIAKQLLLKKKV